MWLSNRKTLLDRFNLVIAIIIVVVVGISSRLLPLGFRLFNKYLGDMLYAVLFYLLLCLVWSKGTAYHKAFLTLAAMIIIESFQFTGIPLQLRLSGDPILKIVSIVLGAEFSWFDMLAYLAGIAGIWAIDAYLVRFSKPQGTE